MTSLVIWSFRDFLQLIKCVFSNVFCSDDECKIPSFNWFLLFCLIKSQKSSTTDEYGELGSFVIYFNYRNQEIVLIKFCEKG